MTRLAALLLTTAAPIAACAQRQDDPDVKADGSGKLPAGWQARLDRADAKIEDVKFATMGKGYHFTSGPAAIYYNPKDVATGTYTVRGTFTQTKAPTHPEAYGLLFAGQDLQGAGQSYRYFLVRQDGKYMIKHRAGADLHTISDWTEHPAVVKADAAGKATNALAVDVLADSVRFMVNGTRVAAFSREIMNPTDGQAGIRVNHNLDVHVEDFEVAKGVK